MLNPVSPLPLKDPTLFRQANYLDGKWVEADNGKTIVVKNPATGEAIGEVPAMGAAETRRAIEAANARLSRLARHAGQGTRGHPAQAVRPDAGQRRRPRRDHDRRAGQAAGREQGRDRLCRQLHRLVRRGGASASTATPSRRTPRAAASWC